MPSLFPAAALAILLSVHHLPAAVEGAVLQEVKNLCDAKPATPDELVRKASLLVREAYQDKTWARVRADLQRQELHVPDGWKNQHSFTFRIPVQRGVIACGGYQFDLWLEFKTTRQVAEGHAGLPGDVTTATVVLATTTADETDELAAAELFGANTVITRVLKSDVRRKRDGDYKFLRKIELSYELIVHHREVEFPFGYHLHLSFGRTAEEDARKRVFITVLSREDLPRNLKGEPVNNWRGWKNTGLGEIQCWGSTEWGGGR